MNGIPLITVLTLTPLVGAALIAGLEKEQRTLARWLGLGFNAVALGLVGFLWWQFDSTSGQPQFVERYRWIPSLNVDYFVAVDGLSLLMVLLAALLMPFALLASWRIADNTKAFVSLMLFLQAGLFGAFTALNFVHWFVFWELTLVPAYFLIKLWGGSRRSEAATQFFIYTMVGSVTLLLSMLAVYLVTGLWDFQELAEKGRSGELASLFNVKLGWYSFSARTLSLLIFFGAFLGFAVKVPLVPFHTWLPATYAEAPTGVSMVLTGVMSKMGVYGFLRVLMPIFPNEMRDPFVQNLLLWLAVATIVASAWAAMAQRDLKRIVAYSSINHLGYCLLGIFAATQVTAGDDARWTTEKAAALNGVILQMFNHGITAAALFYFVGLMEQRAGRRGLEDFGGLRKAAPIFCGLMGIVMFASLGLPGLSGFVGEFLIFKGTFALTGWAAVLSVMGLLTTAVFLLTILQRVWNGPLDSKWTGFPDLTRGERCLVLPAVALIFVLGICPQLVLGVINSTVLQLVEGLKL